MEKKVILPLFEIEKVKMPYVVFEFMGKKGTAKRALLLIDSGSKDNLLCMKAAEKADNIVYTDQALDIQGVGDDRIECKIAEMRFKLGEEDFHEPFSITDSIDFDSLMGEGMVLGILGSTFLRKHKFILDFKNKCLRAGDDEKGVFMPKDAFLFPMTVGFQTYGVPVIGVANGENAFFCVADSGANVSVMAKSGIDAADEIEHVECKSTLSGIGRKDIAEMAVATFSLVSVDHEEKKYVNLIESIDEFNILPYDYICPPVENCPPISMLIGAEFMLQHGWVLDYNREYVYSLAA